MLVQKNTQMNEFSSKTESSHEAVLIIVVIFSFSAEQDSKGCKIESLRMKGLLAYGGFIFVLPL